MPAGRVLGVVTGFGALALVGYSIAHLGDVGGWAYVQRALAPQTAYGLYPFALAILLLCGLSAFASMAGVVRLSLVVAVLVAGGTAAGTATIYAQKYGHSSDTYGSTNSSYTSNGSYGSSGSSSSFGSGTGSGTYQSGYQSGSGTSSGAGQPQTAARVSDPRANCVGLGQTTPIEFYETPKFIVTICSGGGSYGYRGEAKASGASISLAATWSGEQWHAVTGSTEYVLDRTAVRIYEHGELATVDAVGTTNDAPSPGADTLGELAKLLTTSHDGRNAVHRLAEAIRPEVCATADESRGLIGQIVDNRVQLLAAIQSLAARAGSRASLVQQFADSIDRSLTADRAWQSWVDRVWVPFAQRHCSGSVRFSGDPDWNDYLKNAQASEGIKKSFVTAYDPAASAANLKADWKADEL